MKIDMLDFDRFRHKIKLYQSDIHHKSKDTKGIKSPIKSSFNKNEEDFDFVMNDIFRIDNKSSMRFVLEESVLCDLDILLTKDHKFIFYLDASDLSGKE